MGRVRAGGSSAWGTAQGLWGRGGRGAGRRQRRCIDRAATHPSSTIAVPDERVWYTSLSTAAQQLGAGMGMGHAVRPRHR